MREAEEVPVGGLRGDLCSCSWPSEGRLAGSEVQEVDGGRTLECVWSGVLVVVRDGKGRRRERGENNKDKPSNGFQNVTVAATVTQFWAAYAHRMQLNLQRGGFTRKQTWAN